MKNKIETGNIFLIPYNEKFAVCKVLWISKKTKNAFSFVIKDKLVNKVDEALSVLSSEKNVSVKIYSGVISVFYTSIEKLKNGEWQIIGKQDLTKEESDNYQYHNIGGNLHKGDEYIRSLSPEEYKTFPKMLNAGYEVINNFLDLAFGEGGSNGTN